MRLLRPRLRIPAYDGSLFEPRTYPWLATLGIDDRTVMHMLAAVQNEVLYPGARRRSTDLWEEVDWLREQHPELDLAAPLPRTAR